MDDLEDMGIAEGDDSHLEDEIKGERRRRTHQYKQEEGNDGDMIELDDGDSKCTISDGRKPSAGGTSAGEGVDISDYDTRSEVSSEPEYDTRSEVTSSSEGEWGRKSDNRGSRRSTHKLVNERRSAAMKEHERNKERHKQQREEDRSSRHRKSRSGKEGTTKVYDYATKLNYLFRDARYNLVLLSKLFLFIYFNFFFSSLC